MDKITEHCPFCGKNKGRIRQFKTNRYRVVCQNCGANGPSFPVAFWHHSPLIAQNKAIEAWNRRTYYVKRLR